MHSLYTYTQKIEIMKINEILDKYYFVNIRDINKFYNLIVDIIEYFQLYEYINNIEIVEKIDGCYSLYDKNIKKLVFGNNIFDNKLYNNNQSKAIIYILHELIHVIQTKYISLFEHCNIMEFNVLRLSLLKSNVFYPAILPLHEYQAFLNSNYILFNYLISVNKIDELKNCQDIIVNLLYNNYYDNNLSYVSPLEQTIRKLNVGLEYTETFYNNKEIETRILFGMPIEKQDFNVEIQKIKKGKRL